MKAVNIILGIGTAIIVGSLISLGIKAFYPQPTYPSPSVAPAAIMPCAPTDAQCLAANASAEQAREAQYQQQEQDFENQSQVYSRNIFIISNLVGMVVFIVGFLLLFAASIAAESVPIGIMIAGLWGIIYGYANGWGSVDDRLKFFIGLLIAIIVLGGSVWLVERYAKKRGIPSGN